MSNRWTCVLVRHASAGDRRTWEGDDDLRPLDAKGKKQAQALVDVLTGFGIKRVISADPVRCTQTVEPFAEAAGLDLRVTKAFGEVGYADNPDATLDMWLELVSSGVPTVVCSQGGAIPDLMERCFYEQGWRPSRDTHTKKGAYWVLTFEQGSPTPADIELVLNPA